MNEFANKHLELMNELDFNKFPDGLIPVIIQDNSTKVVLMLGFMNREAFEKTIQTNLVTFYSRSRQQLWTKGETSNHFLHVKNISVDCDKDTLLIKAMPDGPVCHTGADTCFNEKNLSSKFIDQLEKIIAARKVNYSEGSYTSSLFKKGINAMAQKVGEEAVELVIEAKDANDDKFKNEAADLLFHYLILLQAKGFELKDISNILEERNKK